MSMSLRIDTNELIAGALVLGDTGLGVRGDSIPASGDAGPAPLYNDITLPADAAAEVRAEVLAWPAAGTLRVNEDSSFIFSGAPDGSYTWTYRYWRDGVSQGINTVNLTVGTASAALAGAAADTVTATGDLAAAIRLAGAALDAASASGALTTQIPLAGSALDQVAAGGLLTTQIPLAGIALAAAGASGTLTVQIAGLGGDALAQAQASGSLGTGIRLAGASLSVATAGGDLYAAPVPLSGSALSVSLAGGILSVQIRLAAAAIARATAAGDLSGGTPANALTAADIDPDYTVLLARDFTVWQSREFTVSRVRSHARH